MSGMTLVEKDKASGYSLFSRTDGKYEVHNTCTDEPICSGSEAFCRKAMFIEQTRRYQFNLVGALAL